MLPESGRESERQSSGGEWRSERQSSGAAERVRDRLAERVREQSSWERVWERKKERKRVVQEQLGSVRVLELGFNKITILPLKMSKLTKQGLFMFRSDIQILADTAGICRYDRYKAGTKGISTGTKHRGQPYRIAGRYGIDNIDFKSTMFLLSLSLSESFYYLPSVFWFFILVSYSKVFRFIVFMRSKFGQSWLIYNLGLLSFD